MKKRAIFVLACVLLAASCSSGPRYYHSASIDSGIQAKVAVLPPLNMTRFQQAPDIITNALIIELLDTGRFRPVDPGEMERLIVERRIRFTDRVPKKVLKEIQQATGADLFLVGSINEFDYVQSAREQVPVISMSMRLISADGDIVWAATHTRRGDDSETIFGLGRVKSLEKLAEIVIHELIETIK